MGRYPRLTLEQLDGLTSAQLNKEWARQFGAPAPAISPYLLRLGIGYCMQEKRQGGVSRETRTLLKAHRRAREKGPAAAAAVPRRLTPGTRLVRDWHGTGHTVTVLEKGFAYDGREWRSLSAIAAAITGTHWNGPKFFGLTGQGS